MKAARLPRPWMFGGIGALLLASLLAAGSASGETPPAEVDPTGPTPPTPPPASVWVTKSALGAPSRVAAELAELGFTGANIMLNDFSRARSAQPFRTHDPMKVIRLAGALRGAGLAVDLTTWVMPHDAFTDGMSSLVGLASATGAGRIWLDAEEPWNRATGSFDYDHASAKIAALLSPFPLVLSAISFANKPKLSGLANQCEFWSPQAYATTRPGSMDPAVAVQSSVKRWGGRFGSPRSGYLIGLAGYDQPLPPSQMMGPCLAGATEIKAAGVCYWAHGAILKSPAVSSYLRSRYA